MSVLAFSTASSRQVPTPRVGGLLAAYRIFCVSLTRGPDAVQLRLRLAEVFLAAHADLTVWMARPLDARLADLRRCKAWPLICFAAVTGRLRCDADLLMAKKLGGLGRCAEDEHPGDFAMLRQAAARLSWGPQFTEQVVRQALVAAIAFTGRAPHELTINDLDEFDAAVDASTYVSASQRFTHRKQTQGVRQLLYEARIVDVPAPTRRAVTSDATRLARAVAAPEILRTMTAYLHNRSTHQTIGLAAAAHAIITLRCFLDDITAWGWAEAPARRLVFSSDIPKQPRALPRALPADVDAALMAAVAQHPDPFARGGARDHTRRRTANRRTPSTWNSIASSTTAPPAAGCASRWANSPLSAPCHSTKSL